MGDGACALTHLWSRMAPDGPARATAPTAEPGGPDARWLPECRDGHRPWRPKRQSVRCAVRAVGGACGLAWAAARRVEPAGRAPPAP